MSQSASPAKQNDMTTSLETFKKERFCGFPHRHGKPTRTPGTRDETRGSTKTTISYETSSDFKVGNMTKGQVLQLPHRHGEATGKPQTRDETGGSTKTSISCETSSNCSHFVAAKSTFSWNLQPQNRCFVRGFRQFPAHVRKCHACDEFALCHHLTQPCQRDLQKTRNRARLKCCACHEKWRWTRPNRCACYENWNTSSENVTKVLRLPRKTIFNTHVWISQSATPATRNEATTRLKHPKRTTSAELTIGTAIRSSHERLLFFLWYGRSRSEARSLHEKKLLLRNFYMDTGGRMQLGKS